MHIIKSSLGAILLVGGASAIGVPIALNSDKTSGFDQKVTGASGGGNEAREEKSWKWNNEHLRKLIKLSMKGLLAETVGDQIWTINVQNQGSDSDGKNKWGLDNQSEAGIGEVTAENTFNDINVFEKFFEYILGEWVEKKWNSVWSGSHWGTSWNLTNSESVVMLGRDQGNIRKVLLHINLNKQPKEYIVGQYEVKVEKQHQKGVLSLGFKTCSSQSGPQCQIQKTDGISKRIEINFMNS